MSEYVLTTSEIFQENLLKYSSLAKRQFVHRHVVPAKLRPNNIKSATTQLKKEQINLKTNLNDKLQELKLKQDTENRKDIHELRKLNIQLFSKRNQLKNYAVNLNTELNQLEKDHIKRQKFSYSKLKSINEEKIPADMEKILFKKIIRYNNGVKKLRELRHELEDIVKVKLLKNEAYELIMNQLYRISRILTETGGKALKLRNERQQILQYLSILRQTSETEKKKISENAFAALSKVKINYDMTEFLRKKHIQRHVQKKVKIHNKINENKITNDELMTFIQFFVDNNLDTDLVKITENKKINECKKESLFHLLIFMEQQITELTNSIDSNHEISTGRKVANNNRHEMNRSQLKMYSDDLQKLTQAINSSQESTEYLKNTYKELSEIIANACQILHIRLSAEKLTDKNVLINEENISDYVKAMVKKSYEMIFKINCIDNNCLQEQDEDTLTSDGESMQNLISKDYNGIEIKLRRLIRI